jgi:hypothetical protein
LHGRVVDLVPDVAVVMDFLEPALAAGIGYEHRTGDIPVLPAERIDESLHVFDSRAKTRISRGWVHARIMPNPGWPGKF